LLIAAKIFFEKRNNEKAINRRKDENI